MKRFLSLLLTCAMLLSLAACGKKDPGGSSSGGGSTSGSTSGDPDASCPDPKDALYALYYTTMSTFVASQQLRESIERQYGQPDAPANGGGGEYLLSSSGFEGNAIVLMPAGQAARLYQQSSGQYQMLAITNLCGPQLLVKGETLSSLDQLRGRTIHAYLEDTDQIAILRHLLVENGLDPDKNVTIDGGYGPYYQPEYSQDGDVYLLDPYNAAAAMAADSSLTLLADLGEEWADLSLGQIVAGCAVARTEFAQAHPEAISAFLSGMEQSAEAMSDPDTAVNYWSDPNRDILLAALPYCGITFATGQEMKDLAEDYYLSLFQGDPEAIGGGLPYDDFYYGVN